ncbi:hypothetical protein Efla_001478 [Eimeria flavescens]
MVDNREFISGDGYGGPGIHMFPRGADASLIFLHGRAGSAEEFTSLADLWDVNEDVEGYERSRQRVENIIQKELASGIKPERIFVAGYSQGGAMSYLIALRSSAPLGGAIALSGWCPLLTDLRVGEAFASSKGRILHAHGVLDEHVDYQFALSTFEAARAAVARASGHSASDRLQLLTYQSLTHAISAKEMNEVVDFLESCLTRNGGGQPPAGRR